MTCHRHVLLHLVAQRVPALIVSTLVLVGGPGEVSWEIWTFRSSEMARNLLIIEMCICT